MQVVFSKSFKKQYKKLPIQIQDQTKSRILLWQQNPQDSQLNLHRLKGKFSRYWSINITGDIRAFYEITDEQTYVFAKIGSHSQLYG